MPEAKPTSPQTFPRVVPPPFLLYGLHSFYTNANAFQLWLHYVFRNTRVLYQFGATSNKKALACLVFFVENE
jgi:hypothetical protein